MQWLIFSEQFGGVFSASLAGLALAFFWQDESSSCFRVIKFRTHLLSFMAFTVVGLSGCGGRQIHFLPDDEIVRLGPDVRGHVYLWNGGSWELSSNEVLLPEGWCVGRIDGDVEDDESRPAAVDN